MATQFIMHTILYVLPDLLHVNSHSTETRLSRLIQMYGMEAGNWKWTEIIRECNRLSLRNAV